MTRNARPYGLIENVVTHSSYRNKGIWINRRGEDVEVSDVTVIDSLDKLKIHILEDK